MELPGLVVSKQLFEKLQHVPMYEVRGMNHIASVIIVYVYKYIMIYADEFEDLLTRAAMLEDPPWP